MEASVWNAADCTSLPSSVKKLESTPSLGTEHLRRRVRHDVPVANLHDWLLSAAHENRSRAAEAQLARVCTCDA